MNTAPRTVTTPSEAVVVTMVCFGLSIVLSIDAVAAGFPSFPFSDAAFHWLIGTELVLASAAVTFLYVRRYAVSTLLPTPSLLGSAAGIALYLGAWLAGWLLVATFAAAQPEQPIDRMLLEARVTLPTVIALAMVNGTYEEVFLLGFLVRGLRGYGLSLALGVPLLVRALCHLYQGPLGVLWVLGFGIVFAVYYIRSGNLWPPVFAHVLWDIVPFVY